MEIGPRINVDRQHTNVEIHQRMINGTRFHFVRIHFTDRVLVYAHTDTEDRHNWSGVKR